MGQSPMWGRPALQVRLQRQFCVVQMPRAATPPGEWICVSLHSTHTVGSGCVNISTYNFFVCGPKFADFPGVKLRISCSWSLTSLVPPVPSGTYWATSFSIWHDRWQYLSRHSGLHPSSPNLLLAYMYSLVFQPSSCHLLGSIPQTD